MINATDLNGNPRIAMNGSVDIGAYEFIASAPVINNNGGASGITVTNAWLNGNLASTGGAPTTVIIYWGRSNGGTIQSAWGHTNNLGIRVTGAFSNHIANLSPNVAYYYRCYATNSMGGTWATDGTASFTTLNSFGSISGTVYYSGQQTGQIWVVAVTSPASWATNYSQVLSSTGAYAIANIPSQTNYWVKAWQDSFANGMDDYWEAVGSNTANPVFLSFPTSTVEGVNVTLTDPIDYSSGWPGGRPYWVEFPPLITVFAPTQNAVLVSSPVTISGQVITSNGLYSLTVYGNTINITNSQGSGVITNSFTCPLSLPDGPHSIDIEAVTEVGRLISDEWLNINVHASGPQFTIVSPTNGQNVTYEHTLVTVLSDYPNAVVTVTCSNAVIVSTNTATTNGYFYYSWVDCGYNTNNTNAPSSNTNAITVTLVATNAVTSWTNQAQETICFQQAAGYNPTKGR